MGVNRGKQFEAQIQNAFERVHNTSVTRLLDPQAGYAGVRNICDYIVYHKPNQYFIECKSVHGNTLSIHSNSDKHHYGDITDTQWEGLLRVSKIRGVVAGYMIWFIDHDRTIFVPAQDMKKLRDDGAKSFNITKWDYTDWYNIKGQKKRVLYEYDLRDFFNVFASY